VAQEVGGMSKIAIPKGMIEAAQIAWDSWCMRTNGDQNILLVLEAALRWLSENPIVPEPRDFENSKLNASGVQVAIESSVEWQRRMFLAPSEVPLKFTVPRAGIWRVGEDGSLTLLGEVNASKETL